MPWSRVPLNLLASNQNMSNTRLYSSTAKLPTDHRDTTKANRLTHVNASGEAHMVDVGSKSTTKRVAIANGLVTFSNPEPYRLVSENRNKKGDALSIARIAGIMGAKRTSDLIPLCHPLAISKVEVDVKLLASGGADNEHGGVSLQAQVECVGPTGVEMEALTAVTVAGLTVYDMCKAVDKDMVVSNNAVVYKSGGKSGLHYSSKWALEQGKEFFAQRKLEAPELEWK